jgi:hypothetical protein
MANNEKLRGLACKNASPPNRDPVLVRLLAGCCCFSQCWAASAEDLRAAVLSSLRAVEELRGCGGRTGSTGAAEDCTASTSLDRGRRSDQPSVCSLPPSSASSTLPLDAANGAVSVVAGAPEVERRSCAFFYGSSRSFPAVRCCH